LKEIENSFEKEKLSSEQANKAYQLLLDFDQVLGLEIQKRASQEIKVPPIIQELVKEREEKEKTRTGKKRID